MFDDRSIALIQKLTIKNWLYCKCAMLYMGQTDKTKHGLLTSSYIRIRIAHHDLTLQRYIPPVYRFVKCREWSFIVVRHISDTAGCDICGASTCWAYE